MFHKQTGSEREECYRIENSEKLSEVDRLLVHARLGAGTPGLQDVYPARPSHPPHFFSTRVRLRSFAIVPALLRSSFNVASTLFQFCFCGVVRELLLKNFQIFVEPPLLHGASGL